MGEILGGKEAYMKVVKHRDNQKTEEKTERKTRIRCKTQKLAMSMFAYLKKTFSFSFS